MSFSKWIKLLNIYIYTDLFLKTHHYSQISLSFSTIRILGCECEILLKKKNKTKQFSQTHFSWKKKKAKNPPPLPGTHNNYWLHTYEFFKDLECCNPDKIAGKGGDPLNSRQHIFSFSQGHLLIKWMSFHKHSWTTVLYYLNGKERC